MSPGDFLDAFFLPSDLDARWAVKTSERYMSPTIWRTEWSMKSSLIMRWALRK